VDIAVCCSSVTAFGRFDEIPPEVFDAVVRTNLCGAANVARAALTHFRARRSGHLVLVGSLLGQAAMPYQGPYVTSKFAINGLVRLLRQENRDVPAIAVHGIYPGPVDTPIYRNAANYYRFRPRPLPPVHSPTRIASAIVAATARRRGIERNESWVSTPLLMAYRLAPAMFDAVIGPFVRAAGFSHHPSESTTGNVFTPLRPAEQGLSEDDHLRHRGVTTDEPTS
jgi:NAD(P)-dependent dehydrogenase (short-subunit alcohol dehydrogenase family)